MSEKRTIRVNRVVNTTSGQNNQTATTPAATSPRRAMRKRTGQRPSKYRQPQGQKPISIAIHNIFKPVNNFAPQIGKSKGFKRTGRKVPRPTMRVSRIQSPRPTMRTNRMQSPVRPRVMPSRPATATHQSVRPVAITRPARRTTTTRTSPFALRAKRMAFKRNRRSIRARNKFIRANRKRTPGRSIANKRVVRSNPFARRRSTSRFFGRKRR